MANLQQVIFLQKPNNFETTYFIGNPDITFFKSVYRRYTNFSKFTKLISSTPGGEKNHKFRISNFAGDLLSKVYLENIIKFPASNKDYEIFPNLGTICFTDISMTFGNNDKIFQNTSDYLEAKSQLNNDIVLYNTSGSYSCPELTIKKNQIQCVNGNKYNNTTLSGGIKGFAFPAGGGTCTAEFFTIPDFSFMKDYGLSIPLLCLRNKEIFLNYNFADAQCCSLPLSDQNRTTKCIVEYINLDLSEKSRFILNDHEYIIEQIHSAPLPIRSYPATLVINQSNIVLKQLLFIAYDTKTHPHHFVEMDEETIFNILIDNENLYENINVKQLTNLNVYEHYKGSGRDVSAANTGLINSIGLINICLYPNNYTQPSGSIAISNNRKITVQATNRSETTTIIDVYKICYNLLKFSNGDYTLNYI